jgi:hypothetical protein
VVHEIGQSGSAQQQGDDHEDEGDGKSGSIIARRARRRDGKR